ncbi:hypothetical protein F4811DRAFT_574686 [Daldinia bambusicola]|nr:hypothetical protein F4811DRAFT_574686 [Daldinia bambusicola]
MDSFSLVSSRPGNGAVISVLRHVNKGRNTYTLRLDTPENKHGHPSDLLVKEVEKWLNDGQLCDIESDSPGPQSDLWDDILRNCCEDIAITISKICIGPCTMWEDDDQDVVEDEKNALLRTYLYVRELDDPLDDAGKEIKKKILEVLRLFSVFFNDSPSVWDEISDLKWAKKGLTSIYTLRRTSVPSGGLILSSLRAITRKCFDLVEYHAPAMDEYFKYLDTKLGGVVDRAKANASNSIDTIDVILENGHRKRLPGWIPELICYISKYYREWNAIKRLKALRGSATPHVEGI